jgi:hypothetical protein
VAMWDPRQSKPFVNLLEGENSAVPVVQVAVQTFLESRVRSDLPEFRPFGLIRGPSPF